ncbi:hypothetical protein [Methylibium sp.]|uniref:hypothetical protein n=1 Tax=Methylibium sp. TaxID=2067992 RepID=UPI0017EB6120|nr:hypothetical protein [Methylibium sp.]MBA3589940.1 hypothetical protein [Methylibium sp.]
MQATHDECEYKIYELRGMPPIIFGETYVIAVGIHTTGPYFKGEYHIFHQRPAATAESLGWTFEQSEDHQDVLTASVGWMIEESVNFAQSRLAEKLFQRAEELNAPQILGALLELRESKASPFGGCRIRGVFHEQMDEVLRATKCASLRRYFSALRQVPKMVGL